MKRRKMNAPLVMAAVLNTNTEMFRRRETEGYLLIDHSDSPGLSEAERIKAGLSPLMPIGKGQVLKAPTFCCSHCDRIVVMNPLRNRERTVCFKCDLYICDDPCTVAYALTGKCRCRAIRIAEFEAQVVKNEILGV